MSWSLSLQVVVDDVRMYPNLSKPLRTCQIGNLEISEMGRAAHTRLSARILTMGKLRNIHVSPWTEAVIDCRVI
jgi:hypothetical protein